MASHEHMPPLRGSVGILPTRLGLTPPGSNMPSLPRFDARLCGYVAIIGDSAPNSRRLHAALSTMADPKAHRFALPWPWFETSPMQQHDQWATVCVAAVTDLPQFYGNFSRASI